MAEQKHLCSLYHKARINNDAGLYDLMMNTIHPGQKKP